MLVLAAAAQHDRTVGFGSRDESPLMVERISSEIFTRG
jgi:hypothetical protein